jgi:coenzyme F420-0:L-glutamate ligase / coenzyme F420-1:gamma-L-glutamate ligase
MSEHADLELRALPHFPLVKCGDDLAELIERSMRDCGLVPKESDIVVVAQKIVSKAQNRIVDLASIAPSSRAVALAQEVGKDPRLVEVILSQSRRVVRAAANVLIVEHLLGYVMANAGVDQSNVAPDDSVDRVLLLPENPDACAAELRGDLERRFGVRLAVIINDSFGRAWRRGTVGVALGASGLPALMDKRGNPDLFGRRLRATEVGFADEIAAAASLLMGQADEARPVIVVRGLHWLSPSADAASLIRPSAEDLFR